MITFDAARHIYANGDGAIVPSVGEVLRDCGLVKGIEFASEEALWRGKVVHEAIRLLHEGALDHDTLHPQIKGYISAYQAFVKDSGFVATRCEEMVYDPLLGVAGTFDAEGIVSPGLWCFVDFKTSESSPSVPRWVGYQLAFYALLDAFSGRVHPAEFPVNRLGLKLMADGRYRAVFFNDKNDYDVVYAALTIWKAKHRGPAKAGKEMLHAGNRYPSERFESFARIV